MLLLNVVVVVVWFYAKYMNIFAVVSTIYTYNGKHICTNWPDLWLTCTVLHVQWNIVRCKVWYFVWHNDSVIWFLWFLLYFCFNLLKKKLFLILYRLFCFFFIFFEMLTPPSIDKVSYTDTCKTQKKIFFFCNNNFEKKFISLRNIFPTTYNNNNTNNYNMNNNNNHSYIHEHLLTPSTPYRLVLNC